MVRNFVVVRNNGLKTPLGETVPGVPLLDQINDPAYRARAYEWEHEGRTYTRTVDGDETVTAYPLPDGSGLVVLQRNETHGPDNVVVLDAANGLRARIVNPYRASEWHRAGDQFWFYGVNLRDEVVVLCIQVRRKLEGKPHDALPLYEASYDPRTWELLKLEWRPWT